MMRLKLLLYIFYVLRYCTIIKNKTFILSRHSRLYYIYICKYACNSFYGVLLMRKPALQNKFHNNLLITNLHIYTAVAGYTKFFYIILQSLQFRITKTVTKNNNISYLCKIIVFFISAAQLH